jgi:hypothetical protein
LAPQWPLVFSVATIARPAALKFRGADGKPAFAYMRLNPADFLLLKERLNPSRIQQKEVRTVEVA